MMNSAGDNWGGTREGAGRKSKHGEKTKPVRIPLSKLPAVQDLLTNDTDIDLLADFQLIESFLFWLAREKDVYLCEWYEGFDEDGIKIPKGFIKYAGSYQLAFEEYKEEATEVENVQKQKRRYNLAEETERFVEDFLEAGNDLEIKEQSDLLPNLANANYNNLCEILDAFGEEQSQKIAVKLLLHCAIEAPKERAKKSAEKSRELENMIARGEIEPPPGYYDED